MSAPSTDVGFNIEVLKLLLQVAWADDQLDPKERAHIGALGARWLIPQAELERMLAHLDQGKPLPQPNLGLLRTRPDAVLAAAEALVAIDGLIDAQEKDFLRNVEELLGRA